MRKRGELVRELGVGSATAVVVGEVIAVGIFLTPAGMAKSLGSPLWLLIVWLAMGGMALCGALCYGELAARLPEAGGGYAYLREAYGPGLAFLYGWMCFLVLDPGITAALAVGLASYVGYTINLSSEMLLKTVGVGVILTLAAVHIHGIGPGATLVKGLTLAKLGLLGFLLVWGFGFGLGSWSHFTPFAAERAGSEPLFGALAGGLVLGFFSFGGWWDVAKLAGEVRDPARTLPKAYALGISVVTLAYILTSAVFLYLVPLEKVSTSETFAAQAGEVLFGRPGGRVLSVIVVVSVLGSLAGLMMSAPRVYYAMARDHLFPAAAARVHPRFGTPAQAIALQAIFASLLVMLGSFAQIVAYFFFVTVVFIALTVGALFVLRRKQNAPPKQSMPESPGPEYRTLGYPVTPALFLGSVAVLLFLLAAHNPYQAFLGVGVVALGAPVYQLGFRKLHDARID